MRAGKEETMSFASPLVWLSLMMSLFFLLLPIALLIILQVVLCKKSRKLGLILPVLSLAVSHGILVLNVPCSFCPLLQRLLLHKSQSFISASSRILRFCLLYTSRCV